MVCIMHMGIHVPGIRKITAQTMMEAALSRILSAFCGSSACRKRSTVSTAPRAVTVVCA